MSSIRTRMAAMSLLRSDFSISSNSWYEKAGAAGIQLEDQEFPKKCGHTPGRRVIATGEMVKKIKVIVETRTDARTVLGLVEALRRGEQYVKADADVIFIESSETEKELEIIGKTFDVPTLVNIVEGGRTPQLTPTELQNLRFSLAIYPVTGFLAAAQVLEKVYGEIKARRGTNGRSEQLYSFKKMCTLIHATTPVFIEST